MKAELDDLNQQFQVIDQQVHGAPEGLAAPVPVGRDAKDVEPSDPAVAAAVKTMQGDLSLNSQKWQLWPKERLVAHCTSKTIELSDSEDGDMEAQPVP